MFTNISDFDLTGSLISTIFLGTGEEVPNTPDCQLKVTGLQPNHRYVFAVAAYNKEGKIIGETIGHTGPPIVSSHPLSVLVAWGHLAQVGGYILLE